MWELPDGALITTLSGHTDDVTALAISLDNKILMSGSLDKTIRQWSLPEATFKSCLIDLKATPSTAKALTLEAKNELGQSVTYTLPCGSPIPPNAVCTCNCVPGTYTSTPSPAPTTPSGTYTYCTCDKVCTCIPVRCQAHRVLHKDPVVRTMAEEILLLVGKRELKYMSWAAGIAGRSLKTRIEQIMTAIRSGAAPNPGRWPSVDECISRLNDSDEIVALMAAQMIQQRQFREHFCVEEGVKTQVTKLIERARSRPWFSTAAIESSSRDLFGYR